MLDCFKNKKILVTGHTGFKGSWLVSWLNIIGANVSGISLPPKSKYDHFNFLELNIDSHFQDINDFDNLQNIIKKINPEFIFHLAAQPLVRESYKTPIDTWQTNVMGTANILNISQSLKDLKGILVITSDKCYENREIDYGYKEDDRLGGYDPYSSSKAATEILVNSFRKSFFSTPKSPLIASARAGNVIGGGDWSVDRLFPDIVRSVQTKKSIMIRNPHATRPWQHVLDCLFGYLLLAEKLFECSDFTYAEAWNFGPAKNSNIKVIDILKNVKILWPDVKWELDNGLNSHEANLLYLDSTKANTLLNWNCNLDIDTTLEWTIEWYKEFLDSNIISNNQINQYMELIKESLVIENTSNKF